MDFTRLVLFCCSLSLSLSLSFSFSLSCPLARAPSRPSPSSFSTIKSSLISFFSSPCLYTSMPTTYLTSPSLPSFFIAFVLQELVLLGWL